MKPVKTLPKFQCEFCKKRSTKHVMQQHEIKCFKNPDRVCGKCGNRGTIDEMQNAEEMMDHLLKNMIGLVSQPVFVPMWKTIPCPDCARISDSRS